MKHTSNKVNVLYHRVSSKTQEDNTSLQYQKNRLSDFCKAKSVGNLFYVCDVDSGAKSNRNGITTIEQMVIQEKVDTIYITKLDRLYRSVLGGATFINLCIQHKVDIQATDEPISTKSPVEMLQINMLLAIADFERSNIASRTAQGKRSAFSNGNRAHGNICIGYKKLGTDIVIDEPNATIVSKIFRRYNKSKSLTDVKKYLSNIGATTKNGKSFGRKSIYNILHNKFYIGKVQYNGNTADGIHTPIISKRLFTAVNS
jgi:site-specific DNA recombinase